MDALDPDPVGAGQDAANIFLWFRYLAGQPYDGLAVHSLDAPAALQGEDSPVLRAGRRFGFGAVVVSQAAMAAVMMTGTAARSWTLLRCIARPGRSRLPFSALVRSFSGPVLPAVPGDQAASASGLGTRPFCSHSPGGEIKGAACCSLLLGPGGSPPRRILPRMMLPGFLSG